MKKYLLTILSAILCLLSFPPFNLEFLIWFAFVPVFFAVESATDRKTILSMGFIFGAVFYTITLNWLYILFGFFSTVIFIYLSICTAVYFQALHFVLRRYRSKHTLLWAAPVLWVSIEFIRSEWGWSKFSWASLGYTQHDTLLILQFASILGIYGISFLIILCNALVFLIIQNRRNKRISLTCILSLILLFSLLAFYGYRQLAQRYEADIKVAIVQDESSRFTRYYAISESIEEEVDIIVWPEYSLSEFVEENTEYLSDIRRLVTQKNTYLILGALDRARDLTKPYKKSILEFKTLIKNLDEDPRPFYNTAYLFSPQGNIIGKSVKIKPMQFFSDGLPGKEFPVFETEHGKTAIKICYDLSYSFVSRNLVRNGAEFLVFPAYDALWWGKPQHVQHAAMVPMRAVENRRFIVRATSSGISQVVNPQGKIMQQMSYGQSGYVVGKIGRLTERTFYTKQGYLFPYFCLIASVAGLLFALISPAGKRSKE